ncbi:phage tail protein [Staphylococcus haemolyticus]|uniref:phage tail protein n=3 Tax=Staphylococcus haemolyticus TaxID=1283 RepID=UPI0015D909EC|nr:phage tail protein [Staphylococcus haemolyticus]
MLFIRDLNGNEYMMEGEVKHEQEINGDERIDVEIEYTDVNAHFMDKHDDLKMWIIGFEAKEYRILTSSMTGKGNKYTISVTAILYMLDWLNSNRIYKKVDGSYTVTRALNLVFDGSPFTYHVTETSGSESFEGLGGGETRLEILKKFIERYEYEITIEGNVMYFQKLIGNDTNFQYQYKVNATDIGVETDSSELYTYIEGYGDYSDDDESKDITEIAKLKPGTMKNNPYVSPIEKILGHRRQAPPIQDGRIKKTETMLKKLKQVVDDSLKVSFTANLNDLAYQGYKYTHAKLGDRIFLVDERIGLDIEIRVIKIDRSYNQEYHLTDIQITFGTKNMAEMYSAKFNTAVSNINDVMAGKKQIPFAALGIVTQSMVNKIQQTSSELSFDTNGIHAIDKNNANNIVTLNSSGMYLSTDGGRTGKTAITAEGITASAITTGEMVANRIRGGTLEALNGWSQWDLNEGSQYYYGNSLIRFYSMYNQIVQSTKGGTFSGGASFETFTNKSNQEGILAYFGTSEGGFLNPRRNEFAGLTVNSDRRAMITGDKIGFSNGRLTNTENLPVWTIDGVHTPDKSEQYFYGFNTPRHNYHLGRIDSPFQSLYVREIGKQNAAVENLYAVNMVANKLNKFEIKEFGGSPTLMFGATGIQFDGDKGINVINSQGTRLAQLWKP